MPVPTPPHNFLCHYQPALDHPLCGRMATWHVVWAEEAGFTPVCEEHAVEGVAHPHPIAEIHQLTVHCTHQHAIYIREERRCTAEPDLVWFGWWIATHRKPGGES